MKLKRKYLQRYREIARLLWKYGRSDLVVQLGMDDAVAAEQQAAVNDRVDNATAEALANDLEAMGPTYVKLGQVLSGRPDLVPQTYIDALTRLQDKVKPFPFEEVKQIVEADLGVRLSKGFSYFDTEPIAAASLGQVHRAALRDGREVVVKVQRPNIAVQIAEDFEVLAQIAAFLERHNDWSRRQRLNEIVEQLRVSIQHELDYEREAQNLMAMGRNMEGFTESLYVPQPINDYCTRRVLTMEYVPGVKITSLSPLARMEMDGEALAEDLFRGYLKQVLIDGLFHADPHPGNIFITQDGHLALLDLGMVGRTTPGMQEQLLKLLIAVSEGKGEQATDVIVEISSTEEDFDVASFRRLVSQLVAEQHGQSIQQINVGRTLLTVVALAAEHGIFVPTELTLLAKTLLQLDEVGKILDPEFDPNAAIRRNAPQLMQEKMRKQATQGSLFSSVLELKDFAAGLPARLNRIMDSMTNREFEIKVRTMDVDVVMEGLQKVANRIASGLILAALIIGAALLMRVETSFVVFGYPGLAILFFLFAACGGIWLLLNIFLQDQRSTRRAIR
jgi:ubiquinone biosynthesis protein